jgi:cellulose synthase/poly-beta-1,6-N-acetylglucosamine synthase-like glycosyltransferase
MIFFWFTVAVLAILIDLLALVIWKQPSSKREALATLPPVSILVPLRNEAHNVHGLIESLRKLDYPAEKLEFLLGEDGSSDGTLQVLKATVGEDPRFRIIQINSEIPGLKAKANVIGQLIPHSTSDFYFITDADVRVPSSWLLVMLSNLKHTDGVIGGSTVVKVGDLWSGLQNIDWLLAQGLIYVVGKIYGTIAVSGTNMMVTKSACKAIGGYKEIPYSLTEDIGVLTAVKKKGFTATYVLSAGATSVIAGQPDWRSLISQRARWTYGVLRLPPVIILLLLVRSVFLISLLMAAWHQPLFAFWIFTVKALIDLLLLKHVARALNQKIYISHFVFFEFYWFLISVSGLLKQLFSSGTKWKGRTYK